MFLCVSISFYQYSSAWRFILNWTIAVQYHKWFKHWKKIQPLPDICTMLLLLLMPKNKHYLWLLFTYLLVFGFFYIYLILLCCVENYRLKIIQTNLTTSLRHLMAVFDAATSKRHHPMNSFLFSLRHVLRWVPTWVSH